MLVTDITGDIYSGEPLSRRVESAHLTACAKSYSILFYRDAVLLFFQTGCQT